MTVKVVVRLKLYTKVLVNVTCKDLVRVSRGHVPRALATVRMPHHNHSAIVVQLIRLP